MISRKFLFTFLMFNVGLAFYQPKEIVLKPLGKVVNVELQENYEYYLFDANKKYLVWWERYMSKVFIYNLHKENLITVNLQQGRGPHEFLSIYGLTISEDNIIYLADRRNIKLIRISSSGKLLKDYLINEERISRIKGWENNIVFTNIQNQKAVIHLLNLKSETQEPFILKKPTRKIYGGLYGRMGHLLVNSQYVVHVPTYYPYFYIYNFDDKKLQKKIKFDESATVESNKPQKAKNGAVILRPPSKVDVLSKDVAYVPGIPNRVFILVKGKTDNRDYELNILYEYDIEKEAFVDTHELNVKAEEIAVNDQYLFVYSKEKNAIFKYKIIISD